MITKQELASFIRGKLTDEDLIALWNTGALAITDAPVAQTPAVAKVKPLAKGNGHSNGNGATAGVAATPAKTRAPREGASVLEEVVLNGLAKGASAGPELARRVNLDQVKCLRVLNRLIEAGKVFRGGERRFSRYALKQEDADAASEASRGKA